MLAVSDCAVFTRDFDKFILYLPNTPSALQLQGVLRRFRRW